MFGVNSLGFSIVKEVFKNIETNNKLYIVSNTERKLTSSVLINSGRVKSFLARYRNVDLNNADNWNSSKWNKSIVTCYEVPKNYFGIDLNPFEIVFVKNIRNVNETRSIKKSGISDELRLSLQKYTEWL